MGNSATTICDMPWKGVFVTMEGDVYPCCYGPDRLAPCGNLKEQAARSIWRGEAFTQLRQATAAGDPPPRCRGCVLAFYNRREAAS